MKQNQYRLVVINGHEVEPSLLPDYQRVYDHWNSVWSATFQEVESQKKFFADNFTRQDEIVALFDGDICIAAMCHRLMDIRMQPFQKDSYFEPWPAADYAELGAYGDKVVIANQFSVDPNYRRTTSNDMRTSELIAYLSFSHLARLPVSGITGTTRNARSANAVFEKYPHTKLADVVYHGEETSLYAFYPHKMSFEQISEPVRELGDYLWQTVRMSECVHPIFKSDLKGVRNVKAA